MRLVEDDARGYRLNARVHNGVIAQLRFQHGTPYEAKDDGSEYKNGSDPHAHEMPWHDRGDYEDNEQTRHCHDAKASARQQKIQDSFEVLDQGVQFSPASYRRLRTTRSVAGLSVLNHRLEQKGLSLQANGTNRKGHR